MAEEKQPILLRLGRGHNGFYCPESRFHLVGVIKPQAHWPADKPFTTDVKRALRGGTLVDINKVAALNDLEIKSMEGLPMNTSDRKKEQLLAAEEAQKQAQEKGEEIKPEQSDILSESDITGAEKKELVSFMKKNELDLEGINSRSNTDELKEALKKHFGYVAAE
jgi:hypothetical protein